MKILTGGFCAALVAALAHSQGVPATASCESLSSLTLGSAEITRAQLVPAGQFAATPAGVLAPGAPSFLPYNALPAFCRVAATLKPSRDSDIKIEVWLPASGWNGKFEGVGNGGWAGTISVQSLARAVARGYAVAMTDAGHAGQSGDGSFAFNHPEKLVDFGYRAVHEMTVMAKALVRGYYGAAAKTSYWDGCSTGGRQGLMEAQRYPDDYDGIVAGAPANYMSHLLTASIWAAHATLKDPASYIPPAKYAAIHKAALDACDALDGVTDGFIGDPTRCRFDPKAILCRGADALTCLTAAQVEAARKIYAPAKNPRTGVEIFPGLEPGSELGWAGLAGGPAPLSIAADYFKYVVFRNPAWDFRTLDFDKDVALADSLDHGDVNAIDPNLKAFFGRGGKLLMYHGWSDMLIAPRNTVNYYMSVVRALGGAAAVDDSIRLFMVPGMGHCAGGEGPGNFDKLGPLEQWVEQRTAPERIVASRPATKDASAATRPLCPYPQVAVYSGTGSANDAANFVCRAR
jgi:feruloyl esterase